ncbi:periplasmic heavy metal sensor [Sphingomonas sp. PAMC 26605]|uniref:periplasmic heavy metal sensor n=1 Tax=Sphingomonas sp. PAMC 26605 TaxID=1112214 RepID=UPI00026CDDEA|nr:periplasmic heavy metal sensor [Sphingomonas sp. PAMC 26605]
MSKLRIALAVSIVLNLFLAGALASGYLTLRSGTRMINAGSLRIAGAELPAGVRRPFRAALRETRRSMRPTIDAARAAKAQAALLLRQPAFDQAATLAALDRARAADLAVRAALERRAVAYAASLSPAERATLADAMKRRSVRVPPAPE